MTQALRQVHDGRQLALYGRTARARRFHRRDEAVQTPLCAGCRAREARYGFRDEAHPEADRPRTMCQAVAAQLARGWNAAQVRLPLDDTLKQLSLRRRRAQIAARHALERA